MMKAPIGVLEPIFQLDLESDSKNCDSDRPYLDL